MNTFGLILATLHLRFDYFDVILQNKLCFFRWVNKTPFWYFFQTLLSFHLFKQYVIFINVYTAFFKSLSFRTPHLESITPVIQVTLKRKEHFYSNKVFAEKEMTYDFLLLFEACFLHLNAPGLAPLFCGHVTCTVGGVHESDSFFQNTFYVPLFLKKAFILSPKRCQN